MNLKKIYNSIIAMAIVTVIILHGRIVYEDHNLKKYGAPKMFEVNSTNVVQSKFLSDSGNVHIDISNQSTLKRVDLNMSINGIKVVEGSFELGGHHYVYPYSFKLANGKHTLELSSKKLKFTQRKVIEVGEKTCVRIFLWNQNEYKEKKVRPYATIDVQRAPFMYD